MFGELLKRLFGSEVSPQAAESSERALDKERTSSREVEPQPPPPRNILDDPAWLYLLERFQCAQSAKDLRSLRNWRDMLGVDLDQAVERLSHSGFIQPASPTAILSSKFDAKKLKLMAKQRGVKCSGTKVDIAERLALQDGEWLKTVLGMDSNFECSPEGLALLNGYLQRKTEERDDVERTAITALREGQFEAACEAVAGYEARQPSPRGLGIDWCNYSSGEDVRFLRLLFTTKPVIFGAASDVQLLDARVAAGMMHLWGDHLNDSWLAGSESSLPDFPPEDVAEQLFHSACHRARLERFRESGLKKCMLLPGTEPCPACLKLENKQMGFEKIPEIPLPNCTSQLCNCCVTAS